MSLVVTQLSDGRLQLWAINPTFTLFSAWQVSLDPAKPWTSLSQFNPSPAVAGTTGGVYGVAAGHSPDGRVQLWVNTIFGDPPKTLVERGTLTTWKATLDPNSAWVPWEPFPLDGVAAIVAVGQLGDGRMQLFALSGTEGPPWLVTQWKVSSQPSASWSAWQFFNPQMQAPDGATDVGTFTSGVVVGSLSDGRLQAWAVGGKYGFSSSWQTSTDPSVAWTNWQAFNAPSQGVGNLFFAAVQICDGLTQMWLNPGDGALQTIRKTSTDPNSAWMAWEPFSPGPGPVNDVVVATLKNGDCQIFVMTQPAANGSVQILTSRQDRSGDHRHKPMQPWTDWASIGTLS